MIDKKTDIASSVSNKNQQVWEEVSQSITAEQTRDFFLNNFAKLDRDGNGSVTRTELDETTKLEQLGPRSQTILNSIRSNFDSLAAMTTRAQCDFSLQTVLTPADLIMFERYHREVKQEYDELDGFSFLEKNFATLDKNADGFFSRSELYTSGQLSTPLMMRVATNFNQIRSASNDELGIESTGITRNDIAGYKSSWRNGRDYFNDTDFHPSLTGREACRALRPSREQLLKIAI